MNINEARRVEEGDTLLGADWIDEELRGRRLRVIEIITHSPSEILFRVRRSHYRIGQRSSVVSYEDMLV